MSLRLEERHKTEQDFHDRAARHERSDFYTWGALSAADTYAYSRLDQLQGQVVLDLGCGDGRNTLRFAQQAALVHAVDLSGGMVEVTRRRVAAAGLQDRVIAHQMSAETLEFADQTFDAIFGHSVLHHTEIPRTRREIYRLLKPGGRAVFLEPLDHNPLLALFRRLTPWRRTPTERPLCFADVLMFAEPFSGFEHREFYLLALAAFATVPLRNKRLFQATLGFLTSIDTLLLRRWPALGKHSWVIVMDLTR